MVCREGSACAEAQSAAPTTSTLWTLFLLAHLTKQVKLPTHSKNDFEAPQFRALYQDPGQGRCKDA